MNNILKINGLILIYLMVSCNPGKKQENIISVSIPPQKYFVEKIAGNRFTVNILVPPGASPETYELSPRQMRMLADSRFYFITGHLSFENSWRERIQKLNRELIISDLSRGIDLIDTEHRHDDHVHHGTDPHIWVSPKTVSIMASNIFKTLSEADPDHYDKYLEGYNMLKAEIFSADSILTALFAETENRSFLIFHPAFGYLARDYNLEQISIEYEGKSPPPAYIKMVIDKARKKNIKAILIQKEFNIDNAKSIAGEINGEIIQVDPLAENWYEEILSVGYTLHRLLGD